MPTQEERITTLEFNLDQFKTETVRSYSDMAYRITKLQGLTEDSIKRLAALRNEINERFETISSQLEAHTAMLGQILAKLDEKK
jgi:hypothetical protein